MVTLVLDGWSRETDRCFTLLALGPHLRDGRTTPCVVGDRAFRAVTAASLLDGYRLVPEGEDADHAALWLAGEPAFAVTLPDDPPGCARFLLRVCVSDAAPRAPARPRRVHRLACNWPGPSPDDRARLQPGARLVVYARPSRLAPGARRVWVVTTGVFPVSLDAADAAPFTLAADAAKKAS